MKRLLLLLAFCLAVGSAVSAPASGQVYTAASTVDHDASCVGYYYGGSFTVSDSSKVYVSPELDVSEAERVVTRDSQAVLGPLATFYVIASEVGTEAVDVTPEYSFDGVTWVTTTKVLNNVGTTAVLDTLNVVDGAPPLGWSYGRWLRFKFDPTGSSGTYQGMTVTYRAVVPKAAGAGCGSRDPVTSAN